MGKASRDKGLRTERSIVTIFRGANLPAERVPLSGAQGGQFSGDVIVAGLRLEVKARAAGFKELYKWLGDNDGLVLKADRKPPLVVLPVERFKLLLHQAGHTTSTAEKTENGQ